MAVTVKRTVRVHNPGKAKRKMSAKQIKFFGTARQKASLKASKRRTNGGKNSVRKTKKVYKEYGPLTPRLTKQLKAYKTRRKTKRRKNVGEIVSIALAGLNPGKKRSSSMAKRRRKSAVKTVARRRKNSGTSKRRTRRVTARKSTHSRRRKNPVYSMRKVHRRRNAGVAGLTSGMLGQAVGVIAGAVGSKYITQLALGGNNTGLMGYAGNAIATVALGWGAKKVTKSEAFGNSVMVGGLVALVLRAINDNTAIGSFVNLSLAGAGKGGDTGIGIIQDSSFPLPQVPVAGSMTSFQTPRNTRNYVAANMPQPAPATGVRGVRGVGNMMIGRTKRAVM